MMHTTIKDLKNIPVSISILHEQEYNILVLRSVRIKERKRRAFSENSSSSRSEDGDSYIRINPIIRRKTLKN
jgi:hypothetical protein